MTLVNEGDDSTTSRNASMPTSPIALSRKSNPATPSHRRIASITHPSTSSFVKPSLRNDINAPESSRHAAAAAAARFARQFSRHFLPIFSTISALARRLFVNTISSTFAFRSHARNNAAHASSPASLSRRLTLSHAATSPSISALANATNAPSRSAHLDTFTRRTSTIARNVSSSASTSSSLSSSPSAGVSAADSSSNHPLSPARTPRAIALASSGARRRPKHPLTRTPRARARAAASNTASSASPSASRHFRSATLSPSLARDAARARAPSASSVTKTVPRRPIAARHRLLARARASPSSRARGSILPASHHGAHRLIARARRAVSSRASRHRVRVRVRARARRLPRRRRARARRIHHRSRR